MAKKNTPNYSPRIVNRRARHDYHIIEKIEVGIALQGSEVKSIRHSQVSLAEGYATINPNTLELFLHDVSITAYQHAASDTGHEPTRTRKLLAHKQQIKKLLGITSVRGTTLVPLALYFVRGRVKLELGVGQGKRQFDKRQSLKKRDAQRDINRAMTRRRL